ncbi:unnamed protein product [Linum tenue]|uniref:Uncharacterized protein n=1 Tax=Linum tenue TaxID=586396 RepID=A0AAV0P2A6_9ROSI|nr:unnamed protein product [Linum tenue]
MAGSRSVMAIAIALLASLFLIKVVATTAAAGGTPAPPPVLICLMENLVVQNCGPSNCDAKCKRDCKKFGRKPETCSGVCATGTFFCNCYGPCNPGPPPAA